MEQEFLDDIKIPKCDYENWQAAKIQSKALG